MTFEPSPCHPDLCARCGADHGGARCPLITTKEDLMNTTPKTPLVLLADAADELHKLADRLTDAAEELLPENAAQCLEFNPRPLPTRRGYVCTREIGHDGPHVALIDRTFFCDAWVKDATPEPEDPRVAVVREWLSVVPLDSDAGDEGLARDLLARLDAVRADA